MGRIIKHPTREGVTITLPDEWLELHNMRRHEAVVKARAAGLPGFRIDLISVMAMIEDWSGVPGLPSNHEEWNFDLVPVSLRQWLVHETYRDFNEALELPKNS